MVHVVIIGAGLAGLTLGDQLVQESIQVTILEGRNQIGGRIKSVHNGLDLGGTWTWGGDTSIQRMMKRFNIKRFPQYTKGYSIYENWNGNIEKGHSGGLHGYHRIHGSPIRICENLASNIEESKYGAILLNSKVQKIQWTQEKYVETDDKRKIYADYIVVAIPPRLAVQSIQYSPNLPVSSNQALKKISTWMGSSMKVLIVYKEAFWRSQGFSGYGTSDIGPMLRLQDASGLNGTPAAIFGFVDRRSYEEESPFSFRKKCLEQMERMFGKGEMIHYEILNWSQEKFTSATPKDGDDFMIPYPSQEARNGLVSENEKNQSLWFGSTETAPDHAGFLEGAIRRGSEIAKEILEQQKEFKSSFIKQNFV